MTYFPKISKQYVIYHKNGIKTDDWVNNYGFATMQELGKKTGLKSRSRSVIKIDTDGQIAAIYKSAREAARHNYMSKQTITDRCNGKVKKAFALDGFDYKWEA
jgi:hypothetical protein